MEERSRVMLAALLGAAVGGVWGWLYMTEQGRRIRAQIDPKLDDFMRELQGLRGTVEKAKTAANEGWRSLAVPAQPAPPQAFVTGADSEAGGTQCRR